MTPRVSKMIGSKDQKEKQKELNIIYKWAEENLIEFEKGKFKQLSHGIIDNISEMPYKGPAVRDREWDKHQRSKSHHKQETLIQKAYW